jgi:hypothetical protein
MTSNSTMDAILTFQDALISITRSHEIPEAADVYGWLVGSWELDALHYLVDVSGQNLKGEVHAARVLEGRAVQDPWIVPRRRDCSSPASLDNSRNMYGTTIRIWDSTLQAWRVTWLNPVTGARAELIGRWDGQNIAQVGTHADGTPIRWLFTEITPDSFLGPGKLFTPMVRRGCCRGNFAPGAWPQALQLKKDSRHEK